MLAIPEAVSKWPTFVRGLVLVVCGIALAFGGCAGLLSNLAIANDILAPVLVCIFLLGLGVTLFGIGTCIVGMIKGLINLSRGTDA